MELHGWSLRAPGRARPGRVPGGNRFRTGQIPAAALLDHLGRGAPPGGILGVPGRSVAGSSSSRAPPGRHSLPASWVPRVRWGRGPTGSVDGGRMRMAGQTGAGRRTGGGGRGETLACLEVRAGRGGRLAGSAPLPETLPMFACLGAFRWCKCSSRARADADPGVRGLIGKCHVIPDPLMRSYHCANVDELFAPWCHAGESSGHAGSGGPGRRRSRLPCGTWNRGSFLPEA
jgi:hypothetical protein